MYTHINIYEYVCESVYTQVSFILLAYFEYNFHANQKEEIFFGTGFFSVNIYFSSNFHSGLREEGGKEGR